MWLKLQEHYEELEWKDSGSLCLAVASRYACTGLHLEPSTLNERQGQSQEEAEEKAEPEFKDMSLILDGLCLSQAGDKIKELESIKLSGTSRRVHNKNKT